MKQQDTRPSPTATLDELDIRGKRLRERMSTQATFFNADQEPPSSASVTTLMALQFNKRICCEIPLITPKIQPKLPEAVKGNPLHKLAPDHDPNVAKATAPVGLNLSSAQIIDLPPEGRFRPSDLVHPQSGPEPCKGKQARS
ncbi:hypothetical protein PtB15_3B70 [Puccinia triticina]|nr:hypothetical protein PtB15_3B70 [Puccinia triticina]